MSKFSGNSHSKPEIDNRANQLNPNNSAYASSRGSSNSYNNYWYDDDDDLSISNDKSVDKIKSHINLELHTPLSAFKAAINGGEMKFVKIPKGCKAYEDGWVFDINQDTFINIGAVFSVSGYLLEEDVELRAPGLGTTLFVAKAGEYFHVILKKQRFAGDEHMTELFIPNELKATYEEIFKAIE